MQMKPWLAPLVFSAALSQAASQESLHINKDRLRGFLLALSEFGKNPEGGVSRLGFSEEDLAARRWVMERMREAGLEVRVDAAANLFGRRSASDPSLPTILFGSHIDSVPKGGNFDGDVGSLGALEVMTTLREQGIVTRHPLEMVIWSNEEGVHFGKALFGSRAATRGPDPGEVDARDDAGVTLSEWLRRYGQDPGAIANARVDPGKISAYIELHIEQGGILHREGIAIGVVQGIVGIDRFNVTVEGFANHAGTTPMNERRDALVAAARLVQAVREEILAKPGRQVGNVGWIQVIPGAPNVVPGLVRMPLELRDLKREVIDDMLVRIQARAQTIAREAQVSVGIERFATDEPALTDPSLQNLIERVAKEAGFSTLRMPSGAGHDAQSLGRAGVPTGMIFVPSKDGISHSPREWSEWDDCARGAEVLYRVILQLDRR